MWTHTGHEKYIIKIQCTLCVTTRDAHIEFNGPAKIHSSTPTATEEKPIHTTHPNYYNRSRQAAIKMIIWLFVYYMYAHGQGREMSWAILS